MDLPSPTDQGLRGPILTENVTRDYYQTVVNIVYNLHPGELQREDSQEKSVQNIEIVAYKEAISELTQVQTTSERIGTRHLESLIIIAECYEKTEGGDAFQAAIQNLCNATSASDVIDDVKALGEFYMREQKYLRGALAFMCMSAIYKARSRAEDEWTIVNTNVKGISKCIYKVYLAFMEFKSRSRGRIVSSCYVTMIKEMIGYMNTIGQGCHLLRGGCEAWAHFYISLLHGQCKKYTDMYNESKKTIALLTGSLRERARNLQLYGFAKLSCAIGQYKIGEKRESVTEIRNSIDAFRSASDFANEEARNEILRQMNELLGTIREGAVTPS